MGSGLSAALQNQYQQHAAYGPNQFGQWTQKQQISKTPHEQFLDATAGKKIRWTTWGPGQYFIPEYIESSRLIYGVTFRPGEKPKKANYFIGNGFGDNSEGDKWEWFEKPSTFSNQVSALKELYSDLAKKNPALSLVKKEKKPMLGSVKGYFQEHKGILFTVGLVILADHFVFEGAFREKIKALVEKFLSHAEKQVASLPARETKKAA